MRALKGVLERWSIDLMEHITADFNYIVGAYADYILVEGSVMDRAHSHPVRNDGFATLRILTDVGGIQKLRMTKPAERALRAVRSQHSASEDGLMNSSSCDLEYVLPA